MPKLDAQSITEADIAEYLESSSDFSFEVKVLKVLTSLGFSCEHSGTYEDPVTKKTREFDIRAKKCLIDNSHARFIISLSVECKNVKSNSPLVVHCMPRTEAECNLVLVDSKKTDSRYPTVSVRGTPLSTDGSPYVEKGPVGKSCDQVGRKARNGGKKGSIIGSDGDVFGKISQSINSAYDLIKEAHTAGDNLKKAVTLVIPVLVVPNDRLWTVWYGKDGGIEKKPSQVKNVEYYIGKNSPITCGGSGFVSRYHLSHMEIVQFSAIEEMIEKFKSMSLLEDWV